MTEDLVRLLDGNTFVVSDDTGDIDASPTIPTGLFSFDTRFLSKWLLSIDGERLSALAVDDIEYFEARFFLVPPAPTPLVDPKVSAIRERSIGGSFHERLTVINHQDEPVGLRIRFEVGSDFADLFEIKDVRKKKGEYYARAEDGRLRLGYKRKQFQRETVVSSTEPARIDEHGLTYDVRIGPRAEWVTELHVQTLGLDGRDIRESLQGRPGRVKTEMRRDLDRWLAERPRLACDSGSLTMTYRRSLIDLAALRFTPLTAGGRTLPAAGLPWFMAIFGRDSIFTSLQALPFAPDLAATTLRLLTLLQGAVLDDFREEEPGKIMHELRYGETVGFEEQPHSPYFGSADATPLYVILIDEYERWTGDANAVRLLERSARAALDWIDECGDIMGNGYIWYQRRNEVNGLENQCWKDSWDAISYHDGRLPGLPRATCELQGYAYDAKIRGARLAREFWNDPAYADRLEREAAELKERFNRDFWVEDGEYYALALDADGGQVDALSSNIGHLLWSGIVEESRAAKIAEHLLGPRLFSGWGVRTLAAGEARYNPLGYHVGTVWPFDNSFIAWGLRRYGFAQEAAHIAQGIIDAAEFFDGRLPEAFAGHDRELTRYPVRYPTACSPQAWSTGTPLLLLRTMLGMDPRGEHMVTRPAVPKEIGRIELRDIPGRWGRADAFGRGRIG
ncbi:glycogen debranching enzyme [Micromonospora kangleipakensis]|uniref:Glycogen debranching enzyme n=1 Tax=Micromonospora kangleipakensis TaxID=1077942 RepID=A0A4Q8BCM3_9ACTN|nr:glycogen debranching N-terminal domain-containing protein [Micromonospora kangleipakensis]RZU75614.1 glycogen debranching enzyme [Micromonospora kangleipakensis]